LYPSSGSSGLIGFQISPGRGVGFEENLKKRAIGFYNSNVALKEVRIKHE
jgi:hypothetical protein